MAGQFIAPVTDFEGLHVKEADRQIIRHLKDQGSLYRQEVIQHSYPFCPRSDTPIIYRTIDSWYVKVEEHRDKLTRLNEQIHWVPEHIQQGRMGNWLKGATDWAISRNRYWGTPLPIWINDETGSMHCVGSIDELAELTGHRVTDLHREYVDHLTFQRRESQGLIGESRKCWTAGLNPGPCPTHSCITHSRMKRFRAGIPG